MIGSHLLDPPPPHNYFRPQPELLSRASSPEYSWTHPDLEKGGGRWSFAPYEEGSAEKNAFVKSEYKSFERYKEEVRKGW